MSDQEDNNAVYQRMLREREQNIRELSDSIFKAHGAGLPANWVYTDPQTTLDLLVAECKTAQAERDDFRSQIERERELSDQLAGALANARVQLKFEELPGAHRTGFPLEIIEAALAQHAEMRATADRSSGTDPASLSRPHAGSDSRSRPASALRSGSSR